MKEPSKGMEEQPSPCESVQTPAREQRRHESHRELSKSEAPIRGLKIVLEETEQCVGDQGKAGKWAYGTEVTAVRRQRHRTKGQKTASNEMEIPKNWALEGGPQGSIPTYLLPITGLVLSA